MLEELQSKIEESHNQLTKLSSDIERMRSIEDALIETDRSITESANHLKSFIDAAGSTQKSLMDAAEAFKDAANTLETIDVLKLSETMEKGNDQIKAEIIRAETQSRSDLGVMEKLITDKVTHASDEVRTEIGKTQENVRQDLTTTEKRLTDSVAATDEAIRNQVKDATTELDATTRSTVAPVKWVGVLTLLVSIAVLVVAVLIFLND